MRIKKVYLKNFKGIKEKKIIDFRSQSTLLTGPNGFGKTTIFDVLELCLTGEIYRTKVKENVTNHRKDYEKPYYQNEKNEDVIIKVWLEKTKEGEGEEEDFIITKFLSKEHDGRIGTRGRRNKPADFELLTTYREKTETFSDNIFDPNKSDKIQQGDIDDFFGFKTGGFQIKHIYNLFNYLQQEETMFFLKKSESDARIYLGQPKHRNFLV